MFIARNTKKCAWCGKQFTPSSPNNKYCCEHCKREGRREKGRNRRMKLIKRRHGIPQLKRLQFWALKAQAAAAKEKRISMMKWSLFEKR